MKKRFDMMSANGIIDAIHYLEGRDLDIGNYLISANYCQKVGYALSDNRLDFYEKVEDNFYQVKCSLVADGQIHYMDIVEDVLVQGTLDDEVIDDEDIFVVYGLIVELIHVVDGIEYALNLMQVE
mgnify:CR=1 FL=1